MQTHNLAIQVPLVDSNGFITGYSEKLHVHKSGLLHLAFSVMIIRRNVTGTEFLLQRRAAHKYHSGNLWTNSCCSHPLMHESIMAAAQRRVKEELGIVTKLEFKNVAKIKYNYSLGNGLIEHEYNHLLVAMVEDLVWCANADEVMAVEWWPVQEIATQLIKRPDMFTAWFPDVFSHIYNSQICVK